MNNQDKHKYIYDKTGIKPRMWYSYPTEKEPRIYFRQISKPNPYYPETPYYPESQLWDMLPFEIFTRHDYEYKQNFEKEIKGNKIYYTAYMHNGGIDGVLKRVEIKPDLHTALLNMTIWAIDNNFIQTKKEGKQ